MEATEIKNERESEINELFKTDEKARAIKLELEKSIESEPYVSYLYSEEKYEQLIFLELRKLNKNIELLVEMEKGKNKKEPSKMLKEIKPAPITKGRTIKTK